MAKGARSPRSEVQRARAYSSPHRQRQADATRKVVIDAAAHLFAAKGWVGTGMREVAATAGVSVETVYALFGSKPGLLQTALEVRLVGDFDDVPLAQRADFEAIGSGDHRQRIAAAARLTARSYQATAGLQRCLREAAAAEADVAELLAMNERRRRQDVATGWALIVERDPTAAECDSAWALLSFELFDLMVGRARWSLRRYELWLADVLWSLVTGSAGGPAPATA